MPYFSINRADLYYETFGDNHAGVPIVLIHGSTITGRADWGAIAPMLARDYCVIVPDCRGHGQSRNTHSYSFKEMAADTVALIRALGYERAHLIGHSNGGNVVLVTLLEYPEVVQTCIPQAANAYVSQDLIDKEPPLFDPARVMRDAPDWMNEMIQLHGPTHGPDYWRELLQLTVREIITEPNYTPADLANVTRPVLVIQGGNDRVNAPMHHAEFIADHIPDAERWVPSGIGHNVHFELTLEWIERVLDFLKRRGDDANDALYRLRRQRYADTRETIFEVHISPLPEGEGPGVRVAGQVLTADQHVQLRAALDVLPAQPIDDQVRVLLTDAAPYALVNRSVADVRREPHSRSEQLTQLLIGEAARILDEQDDWSLIRAEHDGYIGWARMSSLLRCDSKKMSRYRSSAKAIVCAAVATAFDRPSSKANVVSKLPFGVMLPVVDQRAQFKAVRLPDGRMWWVKSADLMPKSQRPKPTRAGIADALDRMRQFVGVPYHWGGRSPFGYDCSGFAQTFYAFMGVSIPRDADQQFRAGQPIEGGPQPGDLLFFSGDDDGPQSRYGHVTHVAISLGGDELIHANGAAWSVSYNSLDPASPSYRTWLREHLIGIRRFR